jgi:GNAT superfamily N-acetyltransferase
MNDIVMEIVDLKTVPQFLPQLAQWHHAQWTYLNPDRSLAQRIADMQPHLESGLIPSTWVAIENNCVLGSASIVHDDMDTHPELAPWLASVFVAPEYRRRGIAAKLVKRVMSEAQKSGIERLYLFTPDQAKLYAGLGWQVLKEERYHDHLITIMQAIC